MSDRFSPVWNKLSKPINNLIDIFTGNEHLLFDSLGYSSKSKFSCKNVDEFRVNIRSITLSPGIPWIIYDTVSNIIMKTPIPMRNNIIHVFRIDTIHKHEILRPNVDGIWQLLWEIDQNEDTDENFVSLDWYSPPNIDRSPNVPIHIIDYIAACISLFRSNLFTPSIATLLIAFESALWDALSAKGINRTTEKITYMPVIWKFKRKSDKLLSTIIGADNPIESLDTILEYGTEGSLEVRKVNSGGLNSGLKIEINTDMVGIFASNKEEKKEIISEKGLSEALQRARKENLLIFPSQLDDTILRLRNNLIHLPLNGNLDPPVSIPGGGEFRKLDQLKNDPKFVKEFIQLIVMFINNIYVIEQS